MTRRYIFESALIAFALTSLSYVVGFSLGWIETLTWLEVLAVFTSYSSVWLSTRQSRWSYPVGIVTTGLYSVLFFQWELTALAIFNLYLVFSLIYGWFRWGPDSNSIKVSTTSLRSWGGYAIFAAVILALYLGVNWLIDPTSIFTLNPIDIGLAVASGVAQLLLDNKKIENWIVWATINVVSIPFYVYNGLTLVAFQYVFFLINTVIAYFAWRKTL